MLYCQSTEQSVVIDFGRPLGCQKVPYSVQPCQQHYLSFLLGERDLQGKPNMLLFPTVAMFISNVVKPRCTTR